MNCSNLNSYLCAKKNGTGIYKFINIGTWTLDRIDLKPKQNNKKRLSYETCVKISTDASVREMIPHGALIMLAPTYFWNLLWRKDTC